MFEWEIFASENRHRTCQHNCLPTGAGIRNQAHLLSHNLWGCYTHWLGKHCVPLETKVTADFSISCCKCKEFFISFMPLKNLVATQNQSLLIALRFDMDLPFLCWRNRVWTKDHRCYASRKVTARPLQSGAWCPCDPGAGSQ